MPTIIYLQFKNSTLDENTIGKATKMSKTDIWRMRSAYRCDVQGEGARQPSRVVLGKSINTIKDQKNNKFSKKTGKMSNVAVMTMF